MAREILFRAKRTDNGEWVEGDLIHSFDEEKRFAISNLNGLFEVAEYTVCQYIGLIDNNGDKIWENDIVNFEEEMYMVDWSETDACFEIFNTGLIERFTTIRSEDCEIIGNKFDNPELLEALS